MDLNLCGTDSNVIIYILKNALLISISKEKYKVQTIQIDCSTYLYYDIILIYNDFKLLYFWLEKYI